MSDALRHIASATLEHPGYVEIALRDGGTVIVGREAIEYYAPDTPPEDGEPVSADNFTPALDPALISEVAATITMHGGGNVWSDVVTLVSGLVILVNDDGAYVYRDVDATNADAPQSLACVYFA